MNARGSVFKYPDNVDTDVIIPARHLNTQDAKELAFREISVEGARKGDRPKVERTVPFLYHWEMDKDNDAYKVTIGKEKYYFAWLFN